MNLGMIFFETALLTAIMRYTSLPGKFTRRKFIQRSALAVPLMGMAFGKVEGQSIAELPGMYPGLQSENKKLGVALVGLGRYASTQLAPALRETKRCYLAGIVTGSPHKVEEWKRKYD